MKQSLTQKDFDKLEAFLHSDKTPTHCMNLFNLDGFLTSLIVGPVTVLPSRWLPVIWGGTETDEMIWDSIDVTQEIISLIMIYNNMICSSIQDNPERYKPLLLDRNVKQKPAYRTEDWCRGFLEGIKLSSEGWRPLLISDENRILVSPVFLFTGVGKFSALNQNDELKKVTPEKQMDLIRLMVLAVHKFWIPHRKSMHNVTVQAISNKTGRNAPCPCGSGKKYKHCCLN